MKRYISLLLILAMGFSLSNYVYCEDTAEIIYSTSFEDQFAYREDEIADDRDSNWKYMGKYSPDFVIFTSSCSTDGNYSVYVSDISNEYAVGLISPLFEVIPGETYSASIDCYRVEGTSKMFFKFLDENKTVILNKSSASNVGAWGNIARTYTAPENAKYACVYLCGDASAFGECYYDNFIFAKGTLSSNPPTAGTYPEKPEIAPGQIPEEEPDGIPVGTVLYEDSFEEDGFSSWNYFGSYSESSVSLSSEEAYDGTYSVRLIDNSTTQSPGIISPHINVTPGCNYTASFYLKTISGDSIRLYLKFYNKDNVQVANYSYLEANCVWTPVYKMVIAPEDAVTCRILIVGVSASLGEAYADSVSLIKGHIKPAAVYGAYIPPVQEESVKASIVRPVDNKLEYTRYTDKGDILGDYSYAGFYGGLYNLPETKNLPIFETLSPTGTQDDTAMIQEAIDRAERKDGGINVIKLKEGRYYVNSTGIVLKSGVLLSGEGQGPSGTIIYGYDDKQYTVIMVEGTAFSESKDISYVTDDYIHSGSRKINVSLSDAKKYKVGDSIILRHNSTKKWAEHVKMWGIINLYGNDTSWQENGVNTISERRITAIEGTEITLDFGVFIPHIKELVPSYITKIDDSGRVENSGIENLRIESYYNGNVNDERHPITAISVKYAKNIFVRDVTSKYFYFGLLYCKKGAKGVSAVNCSCLVPVSRVEGARRYSFCAATGSQQILCTGCYSHDARHDYSTSGQANGPISFVDSVVEMSHTSTEAHGTWATGVLYDNIYHIGNSSNGFTAFANRGYYGTTVSQGWTAAGSVIWNGLASTLLAHKVTDYYQNFIAGVWGLYTDDFAKTAKKRNVRSFTKNYRTSQQESGSEENFATTEGTSVVGDAYKESMYNPVEPRSLYKAQLAERFTGNIANERPNAPIFTYPAPDSMFDKNEVEVTGICQLGAEKVTVYIDNIPYEARINKDNTFNFTFNFDDGVHKIYSTQHIKGVEGNKTADRFITINEDKGNFDYLKSVYSADVTTMILNDTRLTYDKIANLPKIKNVVYTTKDNEYSFNLSVDKNNHELDKAYIVIALYNSQGKLTGVKKEEVCGNFDGIDITLVSSEKAERIKIMLWESMSDLKPLGLPYEI